MMEWYELDEHRAPVRYSPDADIERYRRQMQREEATGAHIVAKTDMGEGVEVSTVFLRLDHRALGDRTPVLFETMIFGGEYDCYQWRYRTWDEAAAGHERIVAALRAGETPEMDEG